MASKKETIIEMSGEVAAAVASTAAIIVKDTNDPTLSAPQALSKEQSRIMGILQDIARTPGGDIRLLHTWPEATRDELFLVLTKVSLMFGRNRVLMREALEIERDIFYGWLASPIFKEWEEEIVDREALTVSLEAAAARALGTILTSSPSTDKAADRQARVALSIMKEAGIRQRFNAGMAYKKEKDKKPEPPPRETPRPPGRDVNLLADPGPDEETPP